MMTSFLDWYQALPPYMRAYWTIAIAVSIIFAIQMILTLVGLGDTDASSDIDFDGGADVSDGNGTTMDTGGAIQLFTIRNMVNFLMGLGWGGVCMSRVIDNPFLLAFAAFVCGCIMVGAFIIMYRQLMKLESGGSFRIEESLGQVCEVYMRIPGNRSGSGKVQISFHGSVQELPAQTEAEAIPSGQKVRVTRIIDNAVLLVEKI